ncbi:MAG: tetratricopeptide repeat protein [Thermoguttaceae bacterium]
MSRRVKQKPPANNRRHDEKAASSAADTRKAPSEAVGSVTGEDAPRTPVFGPRDWCFAVALIVSVFLVYEPAWQGGLIWDDEAHVTRPELRSWHGLYRIWFDVRATTQYYPFVHSVFWVEHKLWGDATLGYHLVNIFLHATAALMVAMILRRLAIPGACLAAAIFALHPLQVESVAWITELKNTLSAVFYLGAAMLYFRFDQTRKTASYLAALGAFLLALATKTVTGTLPGALLVIFWCQRGRLSWKNDVLPLVPFFLLAAGTGMITAWWELEINKCVGPDFDFTWIQRILIAGRTAWFFLWKLFWPANLTFIYPRWQINSGVWWQYLYPLGGAALLAVLWAIRQTTRAPLAALLFFGGTLFPVLGFFNLYTFRYSLVADHYQYLASLGIIALFSAGVALLLKPVVGWVSVFGKLGCLALVALLAVLSWRQSRMYADVETLYRTTIDGNHDCWMAYNNLGLALAGRGRFDEAITRYQKALKIKPDFAEAHNNLGLALAGRGQIDEAIAQYRKALDIDPECVEAHNDLGIALAGRGKVEEALAHFRKALEINPDCLETHYNLGITLAGRGLVDEAIAEYEKALGIVPDDLSTCYNLGLALASRGRLDEALAQYQKALGLASAQNDWAMADEIRARIRLCQSVFPADEAP